MSRIVRLLDSPWFSRVENARKLALWIGASVGLLVGGVALGVAAVVSFPLVAQILMAVGAAGTVALSAPVVFKAVRTRTARQLRGALHDLREELAAMRFNVQRCVVDAPSGGKALAFDFWLPDGQFERHKEALSSHGLDSTRERLAAVYVETSDWNRLSRRRGEMDAVPLDDEQAHAMDEFRRSIVCAEALVRDDLEHKAR